MKLTRRKLKQLIEAFISGPEGTVNLDADSYEFMKNNPNPAISALAKKGPESALQSALLSPNIEDFEMAEYEREIRTSPEFEKSKYKDSQGSNVTDVYARTMAMYDNDPNFEVNLKQKVFDFIGNIQTTAMELGDYYFENEYFDIEGILEFEAERLLEHFAESDARFDTDFANQSDELALAQKGRKTIEKIIREAYEESGLAEALAQIYDSYDFGTQF
jgi:hypothetical protein